MANVLDGALVVIRSSATGEIVDLSKLAGNTLLNEEPLG